jgi:hypothetical protein
MAISPDGKQGIILHFQKELFILIIVNEFTDKPNT